MPVVEKKELAEAIRKAIEQSKKRNFKQSVELIVVFRDIDVKKPESKIRETVFLPYQLKKDVKVCVVADGDAAIEAKEKGAYMVINKEELQAMDRKAAKKVAQDCDWVLVRVELMPLAGRILGPALGPRGKIPVPVPPNAKLGDVIARYKRAVFIRTKDQPQVMCRIGTEDMDPEELAENALAVLSKIEPRLPSPEYNIEKIIVKTTMGPPVEIRPSKG